MQSVALKKKSAVPPKKRPAGLRKPKRLHAALPKRPHGRPNRLSKLLRQWLPKLVSKRRLPSLPHPLHAVPMLRRLLLPHVPLRVLPYLQAVVAKTQRKKSAQHHAALRLVAASCVRNRQNL
jgi:hypothetical protein